MRKMGFIFFNIDKVRTETGLTKIKRMVALKTNEELKIASKFEREIDLEHYNTSLYGFFTSFEKWVENPYETKFVTFEQKDMKDLIEECKSVQYKSKMRDFHKIMSYQYWNIQNEMTYRMGLPKANISLEELLSVYGISFVGNGQSANDLCFNTYTLATHFKMDNERNKGLFSSCRTTEQPTDISLLDFKPIRATGETMLRKKMEEGWNISIECKTKGRGYGMTYEARAYPINTSYEDRLKAMKFGVGSTLEELMLNLFNKEEGMNPHAVEKRKEYEKLHSDLLG